MSSERFDAIIVGAGPAGAAAAYTMSKAGLSVILLERGEFPGAKNLFGGVLYRKQLEDILPDDWHEAPFERQVVEQRLWIMAKESAITVSHRHEEFGREPNCWTGMRVKFDQWFAGKAEQAGAILICETTAIGLIQEGERVIGVRTDRTQGDLYADVVVIADGVNSLLGKQLGVHQEWRPDQVSLAVKEQIFLPKEKIQDRFNLEGDEGVTIEFAGETSFGMSGLGFLYTNKESLSLGIGVMVSDLKKNQVKPYEILDAVKKHPMIRRLIEGGETKEYAGHLIPEGGFDSIPQLSGNGWVICGDAAQLVNFVHREGTNLAMTSGRFAGEAIVSAAKKGDFSRNSLSVYDQKVKESFIHKDLKKYQGLHGLLKESDPKLLFSNIPAALNDAAHEFLKINGVTKADKQRYAFRRIRESLGGSVGMMKLVYKGWRAMNG